MYEQSITKYAVVTHNHTDSSFQNPRNILNCRAAPADIVRFADLFLWEIGNETGEYNLSIFNCISTEVRTK